MYYLEEKGHEVWGIDNNTQCNIQPHPNTVIGDICKIEDLQKFGDYQFDLIIHCAAAKHDWGVSKEEYFSNNEYGTKKLLEYATERKIKKIIYYSTVSVYGHKSVPCDETGKLQPDNDYGASKLAGEKVIWKWQEEEKSREVVTLRPTIIYGPNNLANMYNLIDMLHGYPWLTIGEGKHIKSIVSLENLADMTYFVMQRMKPGIQSLNCIDKPYITLKKLMEIICSHKGFRMPTFTVPLSLAVFIGKIFDCLGSIFKKDFPVNSDRMLKFATATDYHSEKIREMGYKQKHSIEKELQRTIEWYLQNKQF